MVARELGMSPGKVGAQCAHAAVGLFRQLAARRAPWLRAWEVRQQSCIMQGMQAADCAACSDSLGRAGTSGVRRRRMEAVQKSGLSTFMHNDRM